MFIPHDSQRNESTERRERQGWKISIHRRSETKHSHNRRNFAATRSIEYRRDIRRAVRMPAGDHPEKRIPGADFQPTRQVFATSCKCHSPRLLSAKRPFPCEQRSTSKRNGGGNRNGAISKFSGRHFPNLISPFGTCPGKVVVNNHCEPLRLKA